MSYSDEIGEALAAAQSEPPMDTPMPRPLPPRPSTAISGGFSPRFQPRGFDRKSFLTGVFVTSWFFIIVGLLVVAAVK